MGTPKVHLPSALDNATISSLLHSIGLPSPLSVCTLKSTAEYHSIYVLAFNSVALSDNVNLRDSFPACGDHVVECILRVSGTHLPRIKTSNEAAILQWLADHTGVPVPHILHFDETEDNPLGHEYMLMTRVPGRSVADVYEELSEEQMDRILDQLTDVLVALHQHPFTHIGGLTFGEMVDGKKRETIPGPAVEETFWQLPDIAAYWPETESFNTLNIDAPSGYHS